MKGRRPFRHPRRLAIEIDRRLHDLGHPAAGCCKDRFPVLHHLLRLLPDIRCDQVSGLRIDRYLARHENKAVRNHRLGIGADGLGRFRGFDDCLHEQVPFAILQRWYNASS